MWDLFKRFLNELKPILYLMAAVLFLLILSIVVTAFARPEHLTSILMATGIVALIMFILILFMARNNVFVIDESRVVVIERFGQFHGIYDSGLHILIPFLDQIKPIRLPDPETNKLKDFQFIDLRERLLDPPAQTVTTEDNVTLVIDSIAHYRIVDPKKAIYNVENIYQSIFELMVTALRNSIGSMTLDDSLSGRDKLNVMIRDTITAVAQEEWGVVITNVGLQKVEPPDEMKREMERQAIAERKSRALKIEAEGERDAAISKAEGKKRAIEMEAEAEETAIRQLKIALSEAGANEDVLRLKYYETLNKMSDGQATKVFMPFETSELLGSVGMLREAWETKRMPAAKQDKNKKAVEILSLTKSLERISTSLESGPDIDNAQILPELLEVFKSLRKHMIRLLHSPGQNVDPENLAKTDESSNWIRRKIERFDPMAGVDSLKELTGNIKSLAEALSYCSSQTREFGETEIVDKILLSLTNIEKSLTDVPQPQGDEQDQ